MLEPVGRLKREQVIWKTVFIEQQRRERCVCFERAKNVETSAFDSEGVASAHEHIAECQLQRQQAPFRVRYALGFSGRARRLGKPNVFSRLHDCRIISQHGRLTGNAVLTLQSLLVQAENQHPKQLQTTQKLTQDCDNPADNDSQVVVDPASHTNSCCAIAICCSYIAASCLTSSTLNNCRS